MEIKKKLTMSSLREVYQPTAKIWHTPGVQETRTQTAKLKWADIKYNCIAKPAMC